MCGECNSPSSSLYASPPQSHSSLEGLLYYKPIGHVSWPTDTLREKNIIPESVNKGKDFL